MAKKPSNQKKAVTPAPAAPIITPSAPTLSVPTPAPAPAAVDPHQGALAHAGDVLKRALPSLGSTAEILVQSGVHLSPQAQVAMTILMLLKAQNHVTT
jgi:hypothetical protein